MLFPVRVTQRSYSRPVVTVTLIVFNVMVFLHEFALDHYSLNYFVSLYSLRPAYFHLSTLITHMFLHAGWIHLLGNMLFLWVFGENVEDILGHWKFLAFYLLCGVAAAGVQMAANPLSRVPMVGASGAIAGVMGAYLVKFPRSRVEMVFFAILLFHFEMPAWFMLAYWFALQVLGSVSGMTEASAGGVAFFAHVGGFLAGIALVRAMGARDRFSRRRDLYW
jgi:membrane associated rhomboid family serine protease